MITLTCYLHLIEDYRYNASRVIPRTLVDECLRSAVSVMMLLTRMVPPAM